MLLRQLRKRNDITSERGFTLLELLVTIVVLTILAGIAVPVYYHQRRKGWVAHVHAALTHMARAENHHVYTAGVGRYTRSVAELVEGGFRFNDEYVEPLVLAADSGTFCIQMSSAKDPSIVWHFNSQVGHPQEGPGTDESCGLPPGTLVAGEFDSDGNDPDGPETAGRTDTDGDGIPDGEDPTPGGDPSGDPNGGDPSGGDPSGPTGGTPGGSTGGTENPPPPHTGDDCSDDPGGCPGGGGGSGGDGTPGGNNGNKGNGGNGGGGNGGDRGCRDDRNDPDDDDNGGRDEIGGVGGDDDDRDCNNGSGNDDDGEDDNNAGGKGK